ncbi:hypothetical protein, partial [Bradyrhizobium lablabi]|uniref:hypothetical protein n=1 Tax=Bradyrhizobium lablabi TaxID=722472 RepID=UPI001AEC8E19
KLPLIWGEKEAVYFSADDWTTQISLNLFAKLDFTRNARDNRINWKFQRGPAPTAAAKARE